MGTVGLVVTACALAAVVRVAGPSPPLRPVMALPRVPSSPRVRLPLPGRGQASVAIAGVGPMAGSAVQPAIPIASVAKVMTALVLLRDHPLRGPAGSRASGGPGLILTAADAAAQQREAAAGDSTLVVRAGERIDELQLLEALLVPSADNAAEILARWDAGSLPAFVARMNATARQLGLGHTHYADASGLDPDTRSTAVDQVRLAEVALRNPVFAAIVDRPWVQLPLAGRVFNYNRLLGQDGVVGVKTGWTPIAGGALVFAARDRAGGSRVEVVGAVLGARGGAPLAQAESTAARLLAVALRQVRRRRPIAVGERLGALVVPWGRPVPLLAGGSVHLVGWMGLPVRVLAVMPDRWRPRLPLPRGARVGAVVVRAGAQRERLPVILGRALAPPGWGWRLIHG